MSGISTDLGWPYLVGVLLLSILTLGLLLRETWGAGQPVSARRRIILGSGVLALLGLVGTILRPERVVRSEAGAGARLQLLVDDSLRMGLPSSFGGTRVEQSERVQRALVERFPKAKWSTLYVGDAAPLAQRGERLNTHSNLEVALRATDSRGVDMPDATIVVSDGRFDELSPSYLPAGVIHGVSVSEVSPRDVAVLSASTTGVAVAHEAFPLRVVLSASPGLTTEALSVVVSELLEDAPPKELARAEVDSFSGQKNLDLSVVLERAGARLLEVKLEGNAVDDVPDNDRSLVSIDVRRARLRILHIAGRPTYDARALRHFLKSDENIDLVAFFILRTLSNDAFADEHEMALIPFPVEELFTEHLPSFDAIILQDIDAVTYRLERHFPSIAGYVRGGGGLIMVGGPSAFGGGGYAESPVMEVLPVELPRAVEVADLKPFEPRYTGAGRSTPVLAGLRSMLGERLPTMTGTNLVGKTKPGALVLWEHPKLNALGAETPLPILSLFEVADGRSIALTVDGTHQLLFGEHASENAGRAHTALWEGLLGWLMRDPRYERTRLRLDSVCAAERPWELVADITQAEGEHARLTLGMLGAEASQPKNLESVVQGGKASFTIPGLPRGGYAARVQLGATPPTRMVVACEAHAGTFRDSRVDPERLRKLAESSGGTFVTASNVKSLPEPPLKKFRTTSQRKPLLPAYVWSVLTAALLAVHYWFRRLEGLG